MLFVGYSIYVHTGKSLEGEIINPLVTNCSSPQSDTKCSGAILGGVGGWGG